MLLAPLLALFLLPLCLAATQTKAHAELAKLAEANNGLVKLDERTYGLLTDPKRTWSSTVVFTALDSRRKCASCMYGAPGLRV